jgi:hypothetical protein
VVAVVAVGFAPELVAVVEPAVVEPAVVAQAVEQVAVEPERQEQQIQVAVVVQVL